MSHRELRDIISLTRRLKLLGHLACCLLDGGLVWKCVILRGAWWNLRGFFFRARETKLCDMGPWISTPFNLESLGLLGYLAFRLVVVSLACGS